MTYRSNGTLEDNLIQENLKKEGRYNWILYLGGFIISWVLAYFMKDVLFGVCNSILWGLVVLYIKAGEGNPYA